MAKATYYITHEQNPSIEARLVLDGTSVHTQGAGGDGPYGWRRFDYASEKEAFEAFGTLLRRFFHPNHGWRLKEKKLNEADLTRKERPAPLPVKPVPKAVAHEGDTLVIDLNRDPDDAELENGLAAVGDSLRELYIVTDSIDEDDIEAECGVRRVFEALKASPSIHQLERLYLDNPGESVSRVTPRILTGLKEILPALPALTSLHAVGRTSLSSSSRLPALESLSLLADPLSASALKAVAALLAPRLKQVALGVSYEDSAIPNVEAHLVAVLARPLERASFTGGFDMQELLAALLETDTPLPASLELAGTCDDADLVAELALKLVQQERGLRNLAIDDDAISDDLEGELSARLSSFATSVDFPFSPPNTLSPVARRLIFPDAVG